MDFFNPNVNALGASLEAQARTKEMIARRFGIPIVGDEVEHDGSTHVIMGLIEGVSGYFLVAPKIEEGNERAFTDLKVMFDPATKALVERIKEDPTFLASEFIGLIGDMMQDPTVLKGLSGGTVGEPPSQEEVENTLFELRKSMGLLDN